LSLRVFSGLIFGLTAVLKVEATLKNGQIQQPNFDDFPILTMAETPRFEVHLIDSHKPHTGIGESGDSPIARP